MRVLDGRIHARLHEAAPMAAEFSLLREGEMVQSSLLRSPCDCITPGDPLGSQRSTGTSLAAADVAVSQPAPLSTGRDCREPVRALTVTRRRLLPEDSRRGGTTADEWPPKAGEIHRGGIAAIGIRAALEDVQNRSVTGDKAPRGFQHDARRYWP
jgi:hypothetical protein